MKNNRIVDHPVLDSLKDEGHITFTFDGKTYKGIAGDTIASALLANGIRKLRVHEETGTPRGIYCNIGHCYECRVTVDEKPGVRACLQPIEANMVIESGKIQPAPLKPSATGEDLPRTYAEYVRKEKQQGEDS